MQVGPQNVRGGGFVCLVKYRIKNTNKGHDLRAIIARSQDDTVDPIIESAQNIKSFTFTLILGLLMYLG